MTLTLVKKKKKKKKKSLFCKQSNRTTGLKVYALSYQYGGIESDRMTDCFVGLLVG